MTGSFLYWKASGDYLSYAQIGPESITDPLAAVDAEFVFRGKTIDPDFKYKPGYKVGLGYKLNRDRWDLYAEYTRFHQTVDSFVEAKPQDHIHAVWLTPLNLDLIADYFVSVDPAFESAASSWILNLDMLDAEVGRHFFLGRYLTVRPTLGLRTIWWDQYFNLVYGSKTEPSIPVSSLNKVHSWGIGPRFCLNNIWHLYGGLKILGNLGLSLLHTEDRLAVKQINPILPLWGGRGGSDIAYANKEKLISIKPVIDLSLGLGWGRPFFRDKCFFDLLLNYDYSFYMKRDAITIALAPLIELESSNGPYQVSVGQIRGNGGAVSIEGLRVTARLDF